MSFEHISRERHQARRGGPAKPVAQHDVGGRLPGGRGGQRRHGMKVDQHGMAVDFAGGAHQLAERRMPGPVDEVDAAARFVPGHRPLPQFIGTRQAARKETQPAPQLRRRLQRHIARQSRDHGRVDLPLVPVKVYHSARLTGHHDTMAPFDQREGQQIGPAILQPPQNVGRHPSGAQQRIVIVAAGMRHRQDNRAGGAVRSIEMIGRGGADRIARRGMGQRRLLHTAPAKMVTWLDICSHSRI